MNKNVSVNWMLPAGDDCKNKEMMGDWLRRIVVVMLLFLFCHLLVFTVFKLLYLQRSGI